MRAAVARLGRIVFSRENFVALALCLLLIGLMIMAVDSSPLWIYQGF